MKKGTFAIGAVLLVCSPVSCSSPWDIFTSEISRPARPSLVLLTLDTTRSDYVGAYGARNAKTPVLDSLAHRGTRYARALTASPLTLPAHASLLTGLDPPAHGLLDNGTATLHPSVPTLATILSARGYSCAAFVSSRVLDRRFGLDPGFGLYDDFMAAEQVGEYGYPERDAGSVTASAISWLNGIPKSQPYFLWVHYYDPHAPYEPPAQWQGSTTTANYAGEIAYMDQEIGRLLSALPGEDQEVVIAVVGDHGESLGEHGERTHGIFLYRASLEVPLILAGPGVPAGEVVEEVVATRRLMATLLRLLGAGDTAQNPGTSLPGLPAVGEPAPPEPVYSATWMPANTYGWSPLRAVTDQRWRLILAPRPELYDFRADPEELDNLIDAHPQESEQLGQVLVAIEEDRKAYATGESPADPELLAALRSLGYFSGSVPPDPDVGAIDPKDGLSMLAELDRARQLLQSQNYDESLVILRGLVERNPGNVPFLTRLAQTDLESGHGEVAVETYRRAIALSPRLDFLHLNLAEACRELGRLEEATAEYKRTLELNPRSAKAWLALAELALRSGNSEEEHRLLLEALEVGTRSALLRCRLGQIEAGKGNLAAADLHFQAATLLTPGWALPWMLWGQNAETTGQAGEVLNRYSQAALAEPSNPTPYLSLGRFHSSQGQIFQARRYLEQVLVVAPDSEEAKEARSLLRTVDR